MSREASRTRTMFRAVLALALAFPLLAQLSAPARADTATVPPYAVATTRLVTPEGENVEIVRDQFGVPHIFAPSTRGVFFGYGYARAQDGLFELELTRRFARGTLAEVLPRFFVVPGTSTTLDVVAADLATRMAGYTEEELWQFYAELPAEGQVILTSFLDGANRRLAAIRGDVPAAADEELLAAPLEFLEIGVPIRDFTIADLVAMNSYAGAMDGAGLDFGRYQALSMLGAAAGPITASAMFQDLFPLGDPDAPVTIEPRGSGAAITPQPPSHAMNGRAVRPVPQVESPGPALDQENLDKVKKHLGLGLRHGSFEFAIAPKNTDSGIRTILYRGSQVYSGVAWRLQTEDILFPSHTYDVQLTSDDGFNVFGHAYASRIGLAGGYNEHMAFSGTSAYEDAADTYVDIVILDPSTGLPAATFFQGGLAPIEMREETILVENGSGNLVPYMDPYTGALPGLFRQVVVPALARNQVPLVDAWEFRSLDLMPRP